MRIGFEFSNLILISIIVPNSTQNETKMLQSWGGKEHGYGLAECCHRSMKITDSFPKFYYEYYDSDGKLKSIEQDEFSNFIGITNPSEIAYLMCCRIPIPLDDDQKVRPI